MLSTAFLLAFQQAIDQPTQAAPFERLSVDLQAAIDSAPEGATLFADEYPPAIKRGIVIRKSLTLMGGVFEEASPDIPALALGAPGATITLHGAHVLPGDRVLLIESGGKGGVVHLSECFLERGRIEVTDLTLLRLQGSWVDAGIEEASPSDPRLACELLDFTPEPAISAARLSLSDSVVLGRRGPTVRTGACPVLIPCTGRGGAAVRGTFLVRSNSVLEGGSGAFWPEFSCWGPTGEAFEFEPRLGGVRTQGNPGPSQTISVSRK